MHTYIHPSYTHTCIHTCTCMYKHIHTNTHIHTYTHTHIHTYTHAYTHAHAHAHTHTHTHTNTQTFDFEGAARVVKLSVAIETDALHPAILDGMPLAFSVAGYLISSDGPDSSQESSAGLKKSKACFHLRPQPRWSSSYHCSS